MTASSLILKRLSEQSNLALFEFKIEGCLITALSARLREMAREGKVVGTYQNGENFKRWSLSKPPEDKMWEFQGDQAVLNGI